MKLTLKNMLKKQWFTTDTRRSLLLYFCFVVVAALLWFIRVLDKNYTYTITVPTNYENLPLNKAALYHLPKTIDVSVNTDGITLSKHLLLNKKKTLNFDLTEIAQREKTTIQLKDYNLLDSLLHNMTVVEVQPQTIAFSFQKITAKRVKIETALDLQFERQYQLARPVRFKPDSITIYGARLVVDTISRVYTTPATITSRANQNSHTVVLQTVENVSFSDTVVTALIDSEQFTEKKYTIPISYINIPASVLIGMMPKTVTVTVFVGISKVETISTKDFRAIANYDKRNVETGEIPVEIIAKLQNASVVRHNPENVEIYFEID